MNRRGFLGTLLALPVAVKIAPEIAKPADYSWQECGATFTMQESDYEYWVRRIKEQGRYGEHL